MKIHLQWQTQSSVSFISISSEIMAFNYHKIETNMKGVLKLVFSFNQNNKLKCNILILEMINNSRKLIV